MAAVEPGNILDRGPEEYYTSAPHELPEGAGIARVSWQADTPPGTWVKMQLRFAETESKLDGAPWTGPGGENTWFENGRPVPAGPCPGRWAQCRLALGANASCGTPRITRVDIHLKE